MSHWKATFFLLALTLGTLVGCSQPCYLQDCDEFTKRVGVPCDIATNPDLQNQRTVPDIAAPSDVRFPEREPWYITLHEAIALALERGTTGLQTARNLGLVDDDLVTAGSLGGLFPFGDSIRVLALNSAVAATDIEANEARFDVVARSELGFSTIDNPTGSARAFGNGQFTSWGVSLEKAMATGGFAEVRFGSPTNQGITPATNFYSNFTQRNFINGAINPQYTPDLAFKVSQPLLKGWGIDVNSLLPQHPENNNGGAQGLINSNQNAQVGIVIARIGFDQQRADFERAVNFMLANVEVAYWNLYGSFVNLYSSEQALRQAHVTWQISKKKLDAGAIASTLYAQTRGQYEQFRGDHLVALGQVLEAERTLRALLGLQQEDGKRLLPVDAPTVAKFNPDWGQALQECMNLRPELVMQRVDLKQKQLELIREKNSLLPDLRLEGQYTIHGAGNSLGGDSVFASGQSENALRVLAGDHFADYNVGFTFAVPLGLRAQNAAVRASKLRLARSYLQLRDQEQRAIRYLVQQYRAVIQGFDVIQARHQQRLAFGDEVEARFKEFVAGKTTAEFLLQAQRDLASAITAEYQAIVEYNNALVRFQFAKGTLMQFNGIQISEGALPQCAQVRAVEHERQRAKALVLRERAMVLPQNESGNPILPDGCAAPLGSLPALLSGVPDKLDDATPTARPPLPVISPAPARTSSLGLETSPPVTTRMRPTTMPALSSPSSTPSPSSPTVLPQVLPPGRAISPGQLPSDGL